MLFKRVFREKTSMSLYRPLRVLPLAAALLCLSSVESARGEELFVGQAAAITNPATTANAKGLQAGIKAYFDHVNASGGVGGNNGREARW
jgi:hypothetical protein